MFEKLDDSLERKLSAQANILMHRSKTAEESNERKRKLYNDYNSYQRKYQSVVGYEQSINDLLKISSHEITRFRNESISMIERRIESILDLVYPEEHYNIAITFDTSRKNYISEILIGKENEDGTIKWGKPRARDGGFIKQLISFSAIISINLLLGSKFAIFDEPFSSGDPISVTKLRQLFDMLSEMGLQVVMIEHKDTLFDSIPHHEIVLTKHRHPTNTKLGFVELVSSMRKDSVIDADNMGST